MMHALSERLHGGPVDRDEVRRVRDTLLFEGESFNKRLFRFFCLLILAAGISTYGLIGDSVAGVIGAMIVAPLMLPIMGLAFSISIGDRTALFSSLWISISGIATAIAVGFLLTLPMARIIQPENINQIMIRTSPHLVDLLAALVTGLAGAFALSRKDVSDTLPGVAIAVSLVPPLANTGILLALGETRLALGSLLLFGTNYVAILLTGALVFALMGYPRAVLIDQPGRVRRHAIAIALAAVALIILPLAATSYNLVKTNAITARMVDLGREWLSGSGYRLMSVDAETPDYTINLLVLGDGELPSLDWLEQQSRGMLFGRAIRVKAVRSSTHYVETR
ncbi:MAG TPA: DUF389 domain-containing protein [Kiritimatiellia bacterium]|nr:DUF389 domain-containing protein [Kiritimatiellia bacterium]HMO99809.1 DUF389 domain-containing protein [Kiritimatiellia bacterium]HMP97461.1 DUF389 domain-containing protein [Kiritimatiellia bacterium]